MSWLSNFAKSALDGLGSSFGSGLLGGITGFIGNAQQSKNIDKQIRAQQEENQKNREYNFMLAQKQNQWNLDQWNRENAYNDPSQQMSRFRDAGLNPDMIMASGASNLSAPSPQMTSGAPSSPVDMSALAYKPTISQAINSALSASSQSSQIKKNVSDSNKADSETKLLGKEFEWYDVNARTQIDKDRSTTYLNESYTDLNKEQKEYIKKSIDFCDKQMLEIDQKINESKSRQGLIDEQKLTEAVKRACTDEQRKLFIAQTGLTEAEAKDILEYLPVKIAMGESVVVRTGHESYLISQQGTNQYIRNLTQSDEDKARIRTIKAQGNLYTIEGKGKSIDNSWKNINYTLSGINMVWSNINGTTNAQANMLRGIGEIVPF